MIYIVNFYESPAEQRSHRNRSIVQYSTEKCITLSGDWSHTHKQRLSYKNSKDHIYFKTLGYRKNISAIRLLSSLLLGLRVARFLNSNCTDDDKIIISSINIEALLFLQKRGRKIFIDVRDIWPDALPPTFKSAPFYLYYNLLIKLTSRKVEGISYVSPSFTKWISRHYKQIRSEFLPLGFDSSRWSIKEDGVEAIKGGDQKVIIGYIGNLNLQFDMAPIIKLLVEDSSLYLEIVGTGENQNQMVSLANTLGVASRTRFYGYVQPQEVERIAKYWDYGVIPLRIGGRADFPNKFFDYVAMEKPVIVFDHMWLSTFVKKHQIGLVLEGRNPKWKGNDYVYRVFKENVKQLRPNYDSNFIYSRFNDFINS